MPKQLLRNIVPRHALFSEAPGFFGKFQIFRLVRIYATTAPIQFQRTFKGLCLAAQEAIDAPNEPQRFRVRETVGT